MQGSALSDLETAVSSELVLAALGHRTDVGLECRECLLSGDLYDDEHSAEEDRGITQGRSAQGVILIVVHAFDEQPDGTVAVRIISARRATKRERQRYEVHS